MRIPPFLSPARLPQLHEANPASFAHILVRPINKLIDMVLLVSDTLRSDIEG